MKYRILLVSICLAALFSGCSGNAIFEDKKRSFEDNRWQKSQPLTFPVTVEKTGVYSFEVFFSHVYDYQFPEVPLLLQIRYPDSHLEVQRAVLNLKDAQGKELGDCAGDYCDLWQEIRPGRALQPGHYEITLSHEFQAAFLPNVLAVGLRVEAENH